MSTPGTRDHFAGVDTPAPIEFVLLDDHLLFGPLTPTPQVSLAEVVERIVCEHKVGSYRSKGDWRCRSCNKVVGVGRAS